ncbi:MAG: cell division protein FtsA [Chitinophagaceae bacterium]
MNNETILQQGALDNDATNHNNPVIVGLDIGTTKIVAIAGRKNKFGKLEIIGFGKADSSGVNHGMVLNIEECIRSINVALDNCLASNPNLTIKEVYVGIAGQHIKSIQSKGDRVLSNLDDQIRREDINNLIKDQYKTFIPNNEQIIDIIPQDFTVDAFGGFTMQQVIGMSGIKLGANFHIITGNELAIKNIHRAVKRSGLSTKDLVLQPLASAAAVMNADDLEAGVAIVDIGGGTTDLAIFHDGILKHTAVIPRAGVNITNDIKEGLGVLRSQAEQMKVQYGVALAEQAKQNTFITIPGLKGQAPKEISVRNLSNIIECRMKEILEYVKFNISQMNLLDKLNGGIILTGGGSQLQELKHLTMLETGLSARIGLPNEHLASGYSKELMKPMYATCIGLILRGYDDYENDRIRFISNNSDESVWGSEKPIEQQGVFITTKQSFEQSVEDILKASFPVDEEKIVSTSETIIEQENIAFSETPSSEINTNTDLFTPQGNLENEIASQKEKQQKAQIIKTSTIKKIFSSVKSSVMDWLDDMDDTKLDD